MPKSLLIDESDSESISLGSEEYELIEEFSEDGKCQLDQSDLSATSDETSCEIDDKQNTKVMELSMYASARPVLAKLTMPNVPQISMVRLSVFFVVATWMLFLFSATLHYLSAEVIVPDPPTPTVSKATSVIPYPFPENLCSKNQPPREECIVESVWILAVRPFVPLKPHLDKFSRRCRSVQESIQTHLHHQILRLEQWSQPKLQRLERFRPLIQPVTNKATNVASTASRKIHAIGRSLHEALVRLRHTAQANLLVARAILIRGAQASRRITKQTIEAIKQIHHAKIKALI